MTSHHQVTTDQLSDQLSKILHTQTLSSRLSRLLGRRMPSILQTSCQGTAIPHDVRTTEPATESDYIVHWAIVRRDRDDRSVADGYAETEAEQKKRLDASIKRFSVPVESGLQILPDAVRGGRLRD